MMFPPPTHRDSDGRRVPVFAAPLVSIGLRTALMLGLGLPTIALTLHLLRVPEKERLVAGSFFAMAYGLLATLLLHRIIPLP